MKKLITIVMLAWVPCFMPATSSTLASPVSKCSVAQPLDDERRLLDSGQANECEAKLEEILRSDPSKISARELHAESLYQLKRFHFAADEVERVLTIQPDDPAAVLLSGKIYQSLHKPTIAAERYKKFIELRPKDERVQQYSALIAVLESEAAKPPTGTSTRKDVGDYLNAATTPDRPRWKEPSTIRVFIRDGKDVTGYRPEMEESLRQAFDEWHESTNGKIGFVFVPEPSDAQMTVTWSNDLHAPQFTAEAGLAKYTMGAEGYDKAEILLLTVHPFKDGPVGHNFIYNVSLHEIGHALGLQGHSPHQEDIMFPTLGPQQGLSPRDVNTILALYGERQATTVIQTDKDQWGRPLPPKVVADRLTREATNLLSSKQLPEAIAKFEEAIKLESKTPYAKENLAVALNNLAILDETPEARKIELLHQSLYWNAKFDVARRNLNNYLQSMDHDPNSFTERVKLGDQCSAAHDTKGAIVEYTEALAIKEDAGVRNKLSLLMKR